MRNRQRGSAFVMTLVILAGLVAVVASLAASQRVAFRAQIHREERDRARLAALGGVQRAIAELALIPAAGESGQTSGAASSTSTSGATTLQDEWATLGQSGNEKFVVGNNSFRMQIVDASSLININSASEDQWNKLPLSQEEIASILDYRTSNQDSRPGGAKDDYYNNLPEPYNAKLANFETVDELLNVKGMTAKILYQPREDVQTSNPLPQDQAGNTLPLASLLTAVSYAPQLNPQGQAKINVNAGGNVQQLNQRLVPVVGAALANRIAPVFPPNAPRPDVSTMGRLLALGQNATEWKSILDNLAVDAQPRKLGRININTATEAVLQTIPGITPDLASSIVQRQSQGFASLGEITEVPGIDLAVLQSAADFLTASSQTFLVRVMGTAGDTSVYLQALVDVQNGQPKLLMIEDQPFDDMLTRWNWQQDTNTETVLKEAA